MICKNCNEVIPDNLEVCPKCGGKTGVEQQRFCKKCGAVLRANDDFCTSCGSYTEEKQADIETKKQSAISMAALGFVVPILGFILAASQSKSNPDGAKIILGASCVGFIIEASVFIPSMLSFL